VNILPTIQRFDERLRDRYGSVVAARVAPALEVMLLVNMPVALLGRLVVVEAEMHAKRHFRHTFGAQL
jgi:hypothetical protein